MEDPDRVVWLTRASESVGLCTNLTREEREDEDASFIAWRMRSLSWSHRCGLLFLQGASIQQLLAPYVPLRATPRPVYAERPGLDNVLLIEVRRLEHDLKGIQLFAFFLEKMKTG